MNSFNRIDKSDFIISYVYPYYQSLKYIYYNETDNKKQQQDNQTDDLKS
jgi:hypothetical protein